MFVEASSARVDRHKPSRLDRRAVCLIRALDVESVADLVSHFPSKIGTWKISPVPSFSLLKGKLYNLRDDGNLLAFDEELLTSPSPSSSSESSTTRRSQKRKFCNPARRMDLGLCESPQSAIRPPLSLVGFCYYRRGGKVVKKVFH